MSEYQGAAITADQEVLRAQNSVHHSRSSAWANMRFEEATILKFTNQGNTAIIRTDDGQEYGPVRVQTSLEYVLFMHGEPEKLTDISCLLMYRATPLDGFLLIGDLRFKKELKESRIINEPFYM
tara:strand:+ start:159 stop:530 length:372 start_codon:yes stop_codon:yes gene_type:complete